LIDVRRNLVRQTRIGRGLLEVDARLEELEDSLRISSNEKASTEEDDLEFSESEDESEDGEDDEVAINVIPISRLRRRVHQFIYLNKLISRIGSEHPFLVRQDGRVKKVRETLLLDLNSALGQLKGINTSRGRERRLKVVNLFGDMGETAEVVRELQG